MAKKPQQPQPKKKVGSHGNVDWFAARQDYLLDNTISYADIAKKYNCTKNAVLARAKSENWPELRRSLAETAFEDFKLKLLDQKAQAQSEHLISYQNMRALANRAVVEMSRHHYARDRYGNLITTKLKDGTIEPVPAPMNPFELEKLAKALHQAIVGERIVLGMPSSVSAITDGKGDDVFKGLSDLLAAAKEPDEPDAKTAN
jgi:hypothetical protein